MVNAKEFMQIAYLSRQIEWEIQMVSGMPEGDKKKGAWQCGR